MIRTLVIVALVAVSISACATKPEELKSPCVGAEGSPCGAKRPANGWMKDLA